VHNQTNAPIAKYFTITHSSAITIHDVTKHDVTKHDVTKHDITKHDVTRYYKTRYYNTRCYNTRCYKTNSIAHSSARIGYARMPHMCQNCIDNCNLIDYCNALLVSNDPTTHTNKSALCSGLQGDDRLKPSPPPPPPPPQVSRLWLANRFDRE
jgi:hypothetical protein